jgi:tetratricopeptide (TPR) repeat protein
MTGSFAAREAPPVDELIELDEACDRFEAAWLAGTPLDPRDCLEGVSGPTRERLLGELLALELTYRRRRGEGPRRADLLSRFPDDLDAAEAAFEAYTKAQAAPGDSLAERATLTGADQPDRALDPFTLTALNAAGYEVLGELGRGGMGVVYLARKLALNRLCALKMILAGAHGNASSWRFRAEAEAIARLSHPDIVQVYHVGEAAGLPFLELEYLPGGSLDRELDGTPRPPIDSARLVLRVARAIAEAHRQGVVHRDLKPANILLDASGRPKVADFGLAKLLDSDDALTRSQMVIGSPSYMAPELATGRRDLVGAATDVYALGAVLYELLTGRPPFRAASAMETLDLVKHAEPVPPSRFVPGLQRDVETVCLKCLEKDPAARYASADSLAEDLERFVAGEPIHAHPPSLWARACRWTRRRPAVAAAAAVSGVAAGVMLAAGLYYNQRLRVEVQRAHSAERRALEQRNLALGAYKELVFDVQDRLGNDPATRTVRQLLLNTAIDGLDRLAQGTDATPPDLARAVAHQRLGVTYRQVGRADEARQQLDAARQLAERLINSSPRDLALKECLRDVDVALGELLVRAGNAHDAVPLLQRAEALGDEVVNAGPDRPGARQGLIEACFHYGRAYAFSGEPRAAEATYRRMHDLAARWLEDEPDNPRARNFLAMSHRKLGDSRKLDHDPEAAQIEYAAAIRLGDELVEAEPDDLGYQSQLAAALDDLAGVAAAQHRPEEAGDLLREAEQLLLRRCELDPYDVDDQVRLVRVHYRLGCLGRDASRLDEARDLFARAQERLRRLDEQQQLGGMPAFRDEWTGVIARELADCDRALAARSAR